MLTSDSFSVSCMDKIISEGHKKMISYGRHMLRALSK
jgi:hypothetical protein